MVYAKRFRAGGISWYAFPPAHEFKRLGQHLGIKNWPFRVSSISLLGGLGGIAHLFRHTLCPRSSRRAVLQRSQSKGGYEDSTMNGQEVVSGRGLISCPKATVRRPPCADAADDVDCVRQQRCYIPRSWDPWPCTRIFGWKGREHGYRAACQMQSEARSCGISLTVSPHVRAKINGTQHNSHQNSIFSQPRILPPMRRK